MHIANTGPQIVSFLLTAAGGIQQFRKLGQVPNNGLLYQYMGTDGDAVNAALAGPLQPFVAAGYLKTSREAQTVPYATDPLTNRVLTVPELGPGEHEDPYAPETPPDVETGGEGEGEGETDPELETETAPALDCEPPQRHARRTKRGQHHEPS
jgi:hypothetical protein